MDSMLIGVVAMNAEPWELEDNFQRLEAYVREAVRRKAKLVIATESVLDGYVCAAAPDVTREKMMTVAQVVPDGPYLIRAAALARELGIYFIFGFLERAGDELHNTAIFLDPQGKILARYRKVHAEVESFITPGDELRTFETPLGRIGMLICSDRNTVDNFSTLGVQGAEIIFIPMNGGADPSGMALLAQRARDNACTLVVANTASSAIIGPYGEVQLAKYETECVGIGRLYFHCAPTGDARDHFMGRRPDLYSPLLKNNEPVTWFDEHGRPTAFAEAKRAAFREQLKKNKKS